MARCSSPTRLGLAAMLVALGWSHSAGRTRLVALGWSAGSLRGGFEGTSLTTANRALVGGLHLGGVTLFARNIDTGPQLAAMLVALGWSHSALGWSHSAGRLALSAAVSRAPA